MDAYAQISKELEVLKRQVVVAKTDQEKEIVLDKIRDVEKQFRQVKSTETALFKRLLSGEELSEQVSRAFAEKQKAKEEEQRRLDWQNRSLDRFMSLLRSGGFAIVIGSPDTHVELDRPEDVTLGFQVSVRPTQDTTNALSEVQRAWKGNFPVWVEPEIESLLSGLNVRLDLSLKNGTEYSSELYPLRFKSLRSYDLKLVLKEPGQTYVKMNIPRRFVSQVSSVEGRIIKQTMPQ